MFQLSAQPPRFDTHAWILLRVEIRVSAENGLRDGKGFQVIATAGKRFGHHEFKESPRPFGNPLAHEPVVPSQNQLAGLVQSPLLPWAHVYTVADARAGSSIAVATVKKTRRT